MASDLEALYRKCLPEFTRVAAAITGDPEADRDAVQEAFAKALRKRRRFRGEGTLEAWAWRIVVNAARDAGRRRRRQVDATLPVEARGDELGLPLDLLTSRQREVLFLHYYADLDYSAIAHALGMAVGTVGATLSAARQTLRGAWAAVHAFEGKPAPAPVRRTFRFANRATAEIAKKLGKEFPQARVKRAHGVLQVRTRSGPLDLWAAPSTQGGSCFVVDWEGAVIKGVLAGTSACTQRHEPPIIAGTFQGSVQRYTVLYGYARGTEATVRVALTNGRAVTLPVVEHFFLAAVPSGILPASINGRDANGRVVGRWSG